MPKGKISKGGPIVSKFTLGLCAADSKKDADFLAERRRRHEAEDLEFDPVEARREAYLHGIFIYMGNNNDS